MDVAGEMELTSTTSRDYLHPIMTQRSIHPNVPQVAVTGAPVAPALAVIIVVLLITVLHGAGIGFA